MRASTLSRDGRLRPPPLDWLTYVVEDPNRHECRDWPYAVGSNNGYPRIWQDGGQRTATHVALELDGRPRPADAFALHSCDRPVCVAPWHLRWGTPADNMADRAERDRFVAARGEAHSQARLTAPQALEIVELHRAGEGDRAIADRYGVHPNTVRGVFTGLNWSHVTGVGR